MENTLIAERPVKDTLEEKKTYDIQTITVMLKAVNGVMPCDCVHIMNGKCEAIKVPECRHHEEPCPFYRTPEEAAASLERYNARMRSLPVEQQIRYAERYHDGIMTWNLLPGKETDIDNIIGAIINIDDSALNKVFKL